jgi:hypothetical protein
MLVVPRLACPSWRWMILSGHALTRELNGVRVTQLVRGEPTPDPGADGEPAELGTDPGTRPRPPAGGAVDDAKQQADRQLDARGQPRAELFPAPLVHADLAATAALAVADQQRPAARVEVVLGERERFLDAEPGAPQDDDHRSHAPAVAVIGRVAHNRHDLLHRGRGPPGNAFLCCAAGARRGSPAWLPASDAARPRRALTRRSRRPPRIAEQIRRCPTPPMEAGLPLALRNRASARVQTRCSKRPVLVEAVA